MARATLVARFLGWILRRHGSVRSFERELESAGGMTGRVDAGLRTVDVHRVIGSVGRAETLRSDFFYRHGRAMTSRFHRVGAALQQGKHLPPLELYKVKRAPRQDPSAPPPPSEYYVVDGHHRVAMARKLGQDFLDAHVVEYRVGPGTRVEGGGTPPSLSPDPLPEATESQDPGTGRDGAP